MPPPNQLPAAGQKAPLSTEREESTIPMGGKFEGKVWVYPSEQMFFNAMRRKSWKPEEKDMEVVVPIHNAVNEQCWRKILEWEGMYKSWVVESYSRHRNVWTTEVAEIPRTTTGLYPKSTYSVAVWLRSAL
ncbi:hypothetical protein HK104_000728 [Borealophlyctis nickersoniae]|nr:hypothetical protein HK104_000728 [Borealophlyctis nickersoniae]